MPTKLRGGSAAVHSMPARLDGGALLRVSDQTGRITRTETLRARPTCTRDCGCAHTAYQLQGWRDSDLRAGGWAFVAEKGERRLLVAIRDGAVAIHGLHPQLAHRRHSGRCWLADPTVGYAP